MIFGTANVHRHLFFSRFACWGTEAHLGHGWHEVATGRLELVDDGIGRHGPHASDALHVLIGEVGLALLLALGQSHVEGLGAHDAAVHLRHGLGGLLWGGEADEAEALGASLLEHHLQGSVVMKVSEGTHTHTHTHTHYLEVLP